MQIPYSILGIDIYAGLLPKSNKKNWMIDSGRYHV